MNTKMYEKYVEFCIDNFNTDQEEFFDKLCKFFGISRECAYNIWYAEQRSWFKKEMIDVLIDMDKNPANYTFHPNLCSGEFVWENQKFQPCSQ